MVTLNVTALVEEVTHTEEFGYGMVTLENVRESMNKMMDGLRKNPFYKGMELWNVTCGGRTLWHIGSGFNMENLNYYKMLNQYNRVIEFMDKADAQFVEAERFEGKD